jgi:hypothetical protein
MRQRARQAFAANIRRGHVLWEGPGGWVRTPADRWEKSADRQVPQAVTGVFQPCRARGSARQTRRWDRDAPLPLPAGHPGTRGRAIRWRLPRGQRLTPRRTTPSDAGALVSGRTEAKTVREDGRARQTTRRDTPRAPWRMLLLEHHPGAISGADFLHHQPLLAANSPRPEDGAGGAAQRGPALRRGVLRGGRGGRKLQVASRGTPGRVPRDVCTGGRVDRGSSSCLTIGGLRVDRAVEAAVLAALHPAGVQAALAALAQVGAAHAPTRQA